MSSPTNFDIVSIQVGAVHEDLMGGFLRVFEDLNLRTLVILNEKINHLRGSFFDTVNNYPNSQVSFHGFRGVPEWDRVTDRIRQANPRLIFSNTLQLSGPAEMADKLKLPTIGVVHNPRKFTASPECMALAQSGQLDLVGLAPHVKTAIEAAVPNMAGRVHAHFPYEWTPDNYTPKRDYGPVRKICIPGAINYNNRDYAGLVDYLATADFSDTDPFEIHILTGGRDLGRLKDDIASRNIGKYFVFADLEPGFEQIPHATYLRRLYDCDVCLALLPKNAEHYLTFKITTGIMAAIGMGMPIIAPRRVGEVYGFTAIETPEGKGHDFAAADMSPQRLRLLGDQAIQRKAEGLKMNREILEPVLHRILGA